MRTTGAPHQEPDEPRRSNGPGRTRHGPLWGLGRLWDNPPPRVAMTRDVVVVMLVMGVLLGGLWAYSGQSTEQPPIVVVESGSMMHPEPAFGRIGTIDPGDLVLVKRVDPGAISGAYDRESTSYGGSGDVIVFRPMNNIANTPIIHRAVTWVEATPTGDDDELRYDYRDRAGEMVLGAASVDLPEVGIVNMKPPASGFVTKGDNPQTNSAADQVTHTPGRLVEAEWIIGVAKGQAPWVGLIKLSLTGNPKPFDTTGQLPFLRAWAPWDAWVMLAASVSALLLVPVGLETLYKHNEKFRGWIR